MLWSLYFNHAAADQSCVDPELPSNVQCTPLPGSSLGFSHAMDQVSHEIAMLQGWPTVQVCVVCNVAQKVSRKVSMCVWTLE